MRVLLTGTGTGVGKTWAGARLTRQLGFDAWKPAQSFQPGEGPTDAEVLAAATGQSPYEVCLPHRWYPVPLAPPEAADELGLPPFTITALVAEMPDGEALLVEGAGGPRSPLAADGDTVALAAAIEPDAVVVVADAGLGAINDVRLSAPLFGDPFVFLNRFDAGDRTHRRNAEFLTRDGFRVVTDVERIFRACG